MERWIDELVSIVPDCPEATIKTKVREAAILFSINSLAFRLEQEKSVTDGDESTTLVPTTDTTIVAITDCQKDGSAFNDYTRVDTVITFDDAATVDFTLDVTMALRPDRDVDELPDKFYTDWYYTVYHKAAALLYSMPGKPWTSRKDSVYHHTEFIKHMNDARITASRKNDMTAQTIAMRSW